MVLRVGSAGNNIFKDIPWKGIFDILSDIGMTYDKMSKVNDPLMGWHA